MPKHHITKNIEKMVDPIEAGTIHYMQQYMKFIPKRLQDKMIAEGAKKNPYMGFVVQPYSFFLAYEIIDLEWAQSLLSERYRLLKTRITEQDKEAKYYAILGSFNVQTSAFFGTRLEYYIIAEHVETGMLSWVIIDYDTNTVSFDQNNGLTIGQYDTCIHTVNYEGEVIIDIQSQKRSLVVEAPLKHGEMEMLDQRLWLEGNLSVAYGLELERKSKDAFCVMFHPQEVEKALSIPYEHIHITKNTWFPGKCQIKPDHVLCFPYAQHFLSDSPGHYSHISNGEDMQEKLNTIDFEAFPKYSAKSIKRAMIIGQIVTISIVIILIILYFLK